MVKNGEFNSKIRIFIFELIIITLILNCKLVMANAPQTFEQAKTQANKIFLAHPKTLYCGCTFNEKHQLDLRSCHMQSAININRASRLEWEHIMPAENFGKNMACWKKKLCKKNGKSFKGRRCCESISPKFRRQEAGVIVRSGVWTNKIGGVSC
jgi:deoxyribonuclease-1